MWPSLILLIVHSKDKLTAELPVLRSREDAVPLPKVAAHVTGGGSGGSLTEPPAADGEDPGRESECLNSSAFSGDKRTETK